MAALRAHQHFCAAAPSADVCRAQFICNAGRGGGRFPVYGFSGVLYPLLEQCMRRAAIAHLARDSDTIAFGDLGFFVLLMLGANTQQHAPESGGAGKRSSFSVHAQRLF